MIAGVSDMHKHLILILLLAGCGNPPVDEDYDFGESETETESSSDEGYNDLGKQMAWIEQGKEAIKAKLKDPDSAQWRDVEFYSGGGVPIACGEVNANNSFGGKSGFERFVAAGQSIAVLESEMASRQDMNEVWNKFCVK